LDRKLWSKTFVFPLFYFFHNKRIELLLAYFTSSLLSTVTDLLFIVAG